MLEPKDLGFNVIDSIKLSGGKNIKESSKIFLDILKNKGTSEQVDAVLANSGLAIYCAKKLNSINRRMFIMTAAKLVIFGGIITRLFSLQINENKKYLTLSDKNRLREWRLPPVRGDFEDFFGNKIASNLKVYQLHVVPEQVEDFRYLMIRLRDILDIDSKTFKKILKKRSQQKSWETLIISENLSWDQFAKINFYLHEL